MIRRVLLLVGVLFILTSCLKDWITQVIKPQQALAEIQDIQQISSWDNSENINYHIDYPIFYNTILNNNIHFYFRTLIMQKKEEYFLDKNKNWFNSEIHASFSEYNWLWIKSIFYEIFEYYWLEWETKFTKIFYVNQKWEEVENSDIFNLTDNNKLDFKKYLENRINNFPWITIKQDILDSELDLYINDIKFYIDWDYIYFVFDNPKFLQNFEWTLSLKDDVLSVKKYLNFNLVSFTKEETKSFIDTEDLINNEIEKENNKSDIKPKIMLSNDKKYIALTFDDWPSKWNTLRLLDILKENNVRATFFVLWKNASYFPDVLKKMDEYWNEVGSHSWDHPQLTRLKEDEIKTQIFDTDKVIYNAIWKTPKVFRPPYWAHNDLIDKISDRTILLWNVDSLDWKTKSTKKNIENVQKSVKEWSIILMHDIHKSTVDSIQDLILKLKSEGYEFLTVSELLDHYQKSSYLWKVCTSWFNCK